MIFFICSVYAFASVAVMRVPPQVLSGAFVAPAVDYTCLPPEPLNSSVTSEAPLDQCHYYDPQSGALQDCTHWDFDTSMFTSTLTSEVIK